MLSTTFCAVLVSMETRQQAVFFHPPRAGKRLFRLWRMVGDSAKAMFPVPSLSPLRETWDPPPIQPLLRLWLWESCLASSPGHLSLGAQAIWRAWRPF